MQELKQMYVVIKLFNIIVETQSVKGPAAHSKVDP